MIHVGGTPGTSEYKQAQQLAHIIQREWHTIGSDPHNHVWIFSDVQCHGQQVTDIDILLFAYLPDWRTYPLSQSLAAYDPCFVESLCLAFEVKGHTADEVQINGTKVEVYYKKSKHWHDVTQQSQKQLYAVKGYIEQHGYKPPYIENLIWLYNYPANKLPSSVHNIVGNDFTWGHMLSRVQQLASGKQMLMRKAGDAYVMRAARSNQKDFDASVQLFKRAEPAYPPPRTAPAPRAPQYNPPPRTAPAPRVPRYEAPPRRTPGYSTVPPAPAPQRKPSHWKWGVILAGIIGFLCVCVAPLYMVSSTFQPSTAAQNEGNLYGGEDQSVLLATDTVPIPPSDAAPAEVGTLPQFTVVNTNDVGLIVRDAPNGGELTVLPEGTVVEQIGDDVADAGFTWRNIRTLDGREGWVAIDFLAPVPANE